MPALFFHSAEQVLTLAGCPIPRRARDLGELGIIRGGAVLVAGGKVVAAGATATLAAEARRRRARPVDCRGSVLMPGLIDSHTHLVFSGNRVEDWVKRLEGKTYQQTAAAGGGIRLSMRLLRQASPDDLQAQAGRFLAEMAAHGTTTVEVKSGYGLDAANEIKTLETIRSLQETAGPELVPTLLAAHVVPPEYAGRADRYVALIVRRLIPRVAREKLAEFVDCFCDQGAFTVEECRQVLSAGRRHGLTPRIHAEQLSRSGAARLAIELGAASADHLDFATEKDLRALGPSNVVATLLPGVNFHLGLRRSPPARRLIDAGAAVALATDFNPGSSPTLNLQFVMTLACNAMGLTPAEAISASTINAAYALNRAHRLGSLEPGKEADLCVMDVSDYREIPYYFGWNHCRMTVKRGCIIYRRPVPSAAQ